MHCRILLRARLRVGPSHQDFLRMPGHSRDGATRCYYIPRARVCPHLATGGCSRAPRGASPCRRLPAAPVRRDPVHWGELVPTPLQESSRECRSPREASRALPTHMVLVYQVRGRVPPPRRSARDGMAARVRLLATAGSPAVHAALANACCALRRVRVRSPIARSPRGAAPQAVDNRYELRRTIPRA